jgi:hypothetical protein
MAVTDTRLDDGFSTTYEFSENPAIILWEISATPPGWSGGGPIATDTMRNTSLRTRIPKQLKTQTDSTLTVAYAVSTLEDIVDMINVNQEITITFPGGNGTMTFWGYIDSFQPGEMMEGNRCTATMTIIPTNQNDSLVETEPVFA